jgi:apolipoprotein N-acyltransferase
VLLRTVGSEPGWKGGRRTAIGAALLSAVLCALGAPPFDLWPLGLVAWVPLAAVLDGVSPRRAIWVGWAQGIASHVLVLSAVYPALRHAGGCGPLTASALFGAFVALQGGRSAAVALLSSLLQRSGWRMRWAFPCAVVASELAYPMVFPWQTALMVHAAPLLLQIADLGGPLLVSFVVAAFDAGLAAACVGRREGGRRTLLILGSSLAFVGVAALYGWSRVSSVDAAVARAVSLRVGIVQGDLAPAALEQRNSLQAYRGASLELVRAAGPFDLLVWPETALRSPIRENEIGPYLARTAFRDQHAPGEASPFGMPLLTGAVLADRPPAAQAPLPTLFNSAVLVWPNGHVTGRYDKQNLVPIGEALPLVAEWPRLRRLFRAGPSFSRGRAPTSMEIAGHRLTVTICYEDTLGAYVLGLTDRMKPELLVNLTSDAWFGRSNVAALHLALSKMRAIEHRRFLVRAANDGVSAVVDPAGRVVRRLADGKMTAEVVTVSWMSQRTLYDRVGNTPWVALAFALVVRVLVSEGSAITARRRSFIRGDAEMGIP